MAVASLAVGLVRHREDVAADRRDVRAIAFSSYVKPDDGRVQAQGTVQLEMISDGPDDVRVLDARLDVAGSNVVRVDDVVSHHGGLVLTLPVHSGCPTQLYHHGVDALVVRAATRRGTTTTVRVPITQDREDLLWTGMRHACRFVLPDEAFGWQPARMRWHHGVLTATYDVKNAAAEPLVVDAVTAAPGLAVRAQALPLTVSPGNGAFTVFGHARLRVDVRVRDCRALLAAMRTAGAWGGLDGPFVLHVATHHRYGRGQGLLDLLPPEQGAINGFALLVDTCPR